MIHNGSKPVKSEEKTKYETKFVCISVLFSKVYYTKCTQGFTIIVLKNIYAVCSYHFITVGSFGKPVRFEIIILLIWAQVEYF